MTGIRRLPRAVPLLLLLLLFGCRDTEEAPTAPASGGPLAAHAGIGFQLASIEGGTFYTCGVTKRGQGYCWGGDLSGQLGNGTTSTDEPTPVAVTGGLTFSQVSAGGNHTCGVTKDGLAYCWGRDIEGQLGNGTSSTDEPSPVAVAGGLTLTQVSAGLDHTCGVTNGGQAYCWGRDFFGQLGNGAPLVETDAPSLVAGGLTFSQVSAGGNHSCGVTKGGQAYCWGNDGDGQLGNGAPLASTNAPSLVTGGLTFSQVSAGFSHTCGVTKRGQAYCWGDDFSGQLGNGTTSTGEPSPVAVLPPSGSTTPLTFAQVSAGTAHTCGVTHGHRQAYCWGDDTFGELGNGAPLVETDEPSLVAGGLAFTQLSAGSFHTCGVTRGRRQAYCWGLDEVGALGNGPPLVDSDAPRPVSPPGS